jgi:hypothetical protein
MQKWRRKYSGWREMVVFCRRKILSLFETVGEGAFEPSF